MLGTWAVREVDGRTAALHGVEQEASAPPTTTSARVVDGDGVEGPGGRLLALAGAPPEAGTPVLGARLAEAVDGPDTTALRATLARYRAIANDLDEGTPAAMMAASSADPARSTAEYSRYLEGRRVDVPQAALLAVAGVERNADIGSTLAAYRAFVRYDRVSPNAAAMLANAHAGTGMDIELIYQRFRDFLDSGRSQVAASVLATAELESGARDGFDGLSQRLRNAGFAPDDDAVVAAAMLRHGASDPMVAWRHNVDLKNRGVAASQRASLVAAGVASGHSSTAMASAYDFFLRQGGVQESEAAMLTAGWAMRGRAGAGLITTIALRNRDMRDE